MRKTQITIALLIAVILFSALNVFTYVSKDRTAPDITIPDSVISKGYKDGEDKSKLLKGVTAEDDRDGDVSDSLRISEILENGDGKTVTVTYAAKDSRKNVAMESVVMDIK